MKRWFIARQGFYEEPENEGGSLVPKVLAYPDTILLRQWTKPGFNWGFGRIATNSSRSLTATTIFMSCPMR